MLELAAEELAPSRFYEVLREIGFKGAMEKCWKDLDKESVGMVTLKNFAEEEYTLVEGLKAAMIAKSGSIVRCWVEVFDKAKAGVVSKDMFESACTQIGFENGQKVFLLYDIDRSNTISLQEIDQESERARLRVFAPRRRMNE